MPALPQYLQNPPWLHKAIRTALAVGPGLIWFAASGNPLGVAFAFPALCLSVTYADTTLRARHLAAMALLMAALLLPATWLEPRPVPYVPVVMAAMVVNVLVRRRSAIPARACNWLVIFLLYQASQLSAHGIAAAIVPALLILPAALWTYIVCFLIWPYRGATAAKPVKAETAQLSMARQAACTALAAGAAATAATMLHTTHVNWAIWSAITVVQTGTADSLTKSARRVLGAAIGCTAGFTLLVTLHTLPWLLTSITAVLVVLMVAPETYIIAVSIRSALSILAALQLGAGAISTGIARIENISIGVVVALVLVLTFSYTRRKQGLLF